MDPTTLERDLIFPMAVYVFYIFALALLNFTVRVRAIKEKRENFTNYKTFQNLTEERVIVTGRHYDHQFELPMLYFITCTVHMMVGQHNTVTIFLAWLFIALRIGHSFEHLGKNRVMVRVSWFASGWIVIGVLWVQLLILATSST